MTTHHDDCGCLHNRVIDEVLVKLAEARRQMKEEGIMVTIGGLIAAVEEMKS